MDFVKETIIHSEQGSHYTNTTFIQIMNDAKIRHSMSRRGNCWDNGSQESFLGHMKNHLMERISGATKYLIMPNPPKLPSYDKKPENIGKKRRIESRSIC